MYSDIPILLIDIEGFSKIDGVVEKRGLLTELQQQLTTAARFFMPFGEPWKKWKRHGTGDGYYFLFDGQLGPQVALRYFQAIGEQLAAYNSGVGVDLPIRVRGVLAFGDVEFVDDQLLSEEFILAERFISDPPFKNFAQSRPAPTALSVTRLFHYQLVKDLGVAELFPEAALRQRVWNPVVVVDKHGNRFEGYVEGADWSSVPSPPPEPVPCEPVRVGILIGHGVNDPLPQAVEWAQAAINHWQQSHLRLNIWIDQATTGALRGLAQRGCDVLIYYGHGTEAGRLAFVDGARDLGQLSHDLGLSEFWERLQGVIIFACYGERFATELKTPWISFGESILRDAPRGFMHALANALQSEPWRTAVVMARTRVAAEMQSSFADALQFSALPWPEVRVDPGEPVLERGTPGLLSTLDVDLASLELDGARYPEHDPFVGRTGDLERLRRLPRLDSETWRQAHWVFGAASMGKSALLRQHACQVRDLAFCDCGEPVWLLHAYCQNHIQPRDLEQMLFEKANRLYGAKSQWSGVPASLSELFERLKRVPGVHVWILDDLTYLRNLPGKEEQAYRVPRTLLELARQYQVALQLVVSARFRGPEGWDVIEVRDLDGSEAFDLARRIIRAQGQPQSGPLLDWSEVATLFELCGKSTGHFKRALMLAFLNGQTVSEYIGLLQQRGGLEQQDREDFAKRLVEREIELLQQSAARHRFQYRAFLELCWPLMRRVGHFSQRELEQWFGSRLLDSTDGPIAIAYRNGLTTLVRLGFLGVRKEAGEQRFLLPPNQRVVMQAYAAEPGELPAEIPWRAPRAALSGALERVQKGSLEAVGEILSLESVYGEFDREANVAEVVAEAMFIRAQFVGFSNARQEIEVYDEVVSRFGDRPEAPLAEQVAKSLRNKGVRLGVLGDSAGEIAVYDEVVSRFGDRPEAPLAEQVAKSLVNKGITLGQLGDSAGAIAVYDEVVSRFGDRPEAPLAEQVATSIARLVFVLTGSGDHNAAKQLFTRESARLATLPEGLQALLRKVVGLS